MKRLIIFITVLFFTFNLFAQEEKGRNKFVIGGDLNFFIQNNTQPNTYFYFSTNLYKRTLFSINPYLGKELNKNLLFGFQLGYHIGKYDFPETTSQGNSEVKRISIAGFTRYCFNPENKFRFYLQAYAGYNSIKKSQKPTSFLQITDETSIYFETGITSLIFIPITQKLTITSRFGKLFYQTGETNFNVEDTIAPAREKVKFNTFGLDLKALTLYFGLEFQF